jgi:hypothetical protein
MLEAIQKITTDSVHVLNANGDVCVIAIELTPIMHFLTQATKRAILATGFLLRYGEELATDKDIINSVMEDIRQEALLLHKGVQQ